MLIPMEIILKFKMMSFESNSVRLHLDAPIHFFLLQPCQKTKYVIDVPFQT